MFEVFDHTADLGLRVAAGDLNTLFVEAGRAFLSVLVSNPDAVEPSESLPVTVGGGDLDYLLLDWLTELLFLFESRRFLAKDFDVSIENDGLSAAVRGEAFNSERHVLAHEIKAVTYHGLKVGQTEEGWLAEVILDI